MVTDPRLEKPKKIAVGLSGGVDSATTAAILKEQGHEVIGVHMRRTDLGMEGCTAETDMADARKVAEHLDIPFKIYDFRDEYKKRVIDRFIAEYQAGRTPNPDIWCNEEMKFGLFMGRALNDLEVNYVATGHYARVKMRKNAEANAENRGGEYYSLLSGVDETKDQSYFLYRLNQHQLSKALFPLGGRYKREVRAIADRLSLPVAEKPDSVGICFIGDIDLKKFLKEKIDFEPGEVVNTKGEVIGHHDGVQFYTLGQRHGFEITKYQGDPVYVIDKKVEENRLVVGRDEESNVSEFVVMDLHWINEEARSWKLEASQETGSLKSESSIQHLDSTPVSSVYPQASSLRVRIRHLGELMTCSLNFDSQMSSVSCQLSRATRGVAPGQHAVFYMGDEVLGGGVIESIQKHVEN